MAGRSEEEYQALFPQPRLDSDLTRQRFVGKVCIVTGAAQGIGRAIVERFLNDGASVHGFDINEEQMKNVDQALKSKGLPVEFHKVDLRDKAQCLAAVASVAEKHGGQLHFLVNCAAVFVFKGLTADNEDWDACMDVQVKGASNMVQSCLPYMEKVGGENCAIVNIASISSTFPQKTLWTYNTTKAAILMLTRCMALDLAPKKIRVNCVSPGWTWSPTYYTVSSGNKKDGSESVKKCHMLNRTAEMAEVAASVCFLCSKDASFTTGVNLPVDGGYSTMGPEGLGSETGEVYKKFSKK